MCVCAFACACLSVCAYELIGLSLLMCIVAIGFTWCADGDGVVLLLADGVLMLISMARNHMAMLVSCALATQIIP